MHVIHVVDLTAVSGEFGSAEVLTALEEAGQQAVDDVIHRAEDAGLRSVEASILEWDTCPSHLGLRGRTRYRPHRDGDARRTGLERYLLGSVTEKIVRVADVPVPTVSLPEKQ